MKDKISPHKGVLEVTDSDFFQEIHTLESLLTFDCTLEIVNNLIQLYTQAIEHFESYQDPAFQTYTKKLQSLLRNPQVMTLLSSPKATTPPLSPKARKSRKELSCERVIERTFLNLESENSLISEKIQENIKQQNQNFYSKLVSRKQKIRQKKKFLAFEQGVEHIMEEFVKVKGKCISEVKEKYSDSLKELRNMKQNNIVKCVVEEIEKRMNEEVEIKVEEIEKSKKNEILRLKSAVQLEIG